MNQFYFRFGVVCAFVSNEYLEDGVKELPSNVKKSLNDTRLFINNTKTVKKTFNFNFIIRFNLIYLTNNLKLLYISNQPSNSLKTYFDQLARK